MKIAAFYENIREGAGKAHVSVDRALSGLKAAGLDNIYANYTVFRDDLPRLRRSMKKNGIGLEGLYGFFDVAHNPDEEAFKECVDLAAEYGGKNILLLPGIIVPGEEAEKDRIRENMRIGLERAAAYAKGTGVVVTLEDFDGAVAPYNCIAGMQWFMENTDGLRCSFDTGNFCMFSEDPLEAFHLLKPYIATVHVKDRSLSPVNPGDKKKECADGSAVYPCPAGRGYIPIPEIIAELKADGYEGGLIAELYDCDPDTLLDEIANSVSYLKSLAE